MKEIKLTIDGKEVQLTDKQLRLLGIIEKEKSPFQRSYYGCCYYTITSYDGIERYADLRDDYAEAMFEGANYFSTQPFAKQVALHQLLYRKLLKFAYENEVEDTAEWDEINPHWSIEYDTHCNAFTSDWHKIYKMQDVYFSSKEGANRAIKEVVEPFVKEHPEFVW